MPAASFSDMTELTRTASVVCVALNTMKILPTFSFAQTLRALVFFIELLSVAVPFGLTQQPLRATALAMEQNGNSEGAEQVWKDLAKAHQGDPEPPAHIGLLEARQLHYDAAIESYKQALALKPDYPGLRLNLGLAYFKAAQFPDAIRSFKLELKRAPEDQRLTILLGMAHYGMGDYLVAIPYLSQAADRDRQSLPLRLTLAHSCLWSKQYDCVLTVEKEILALNSESAEADMLAGEALDEMGDDAGAVEQFRSAVRANPKEPNVHFGLGYLLWKQSKVAEAATEFQAEIVNDPTHKNARAYLGDSYVILSHYAEAEPELLKAAADAPSIAMVHRDLGIVYANTNRKDRAIEELQLAISLDPQDMAPHWRLAKLYQSSGKKDEAKAEFATASKLNKATDEALTSKMSGSQTGQP